MLQRVTLRFTACWALVVSAGCASQYDYVWADHMPQDSSPELLAPGDTIAVVVKGHAPASGEFRIQKGGSYLQPLVGPIPVAGLTLEQATERLRERLMGILVRPEITLSVSIPRTVRVSVLGEVRRPGHFDLSLGEGVLGALARAGDLTDFASRDSIYVLRKTQSTPQRIRFRYADLQGGLSKSAGFQLADGDVVVVE